MKKDKDKKNALKLRVFIYVLLGALIIFLAIFFGVRIISGLADTDGEIISEISGDSFALKSANQNMRDGQSVNLSDQSVVMQMVSYTVTYLAGQHGTLSGDKLSQKTESVAKGKTPASVPFVNAEDGYTFTGWYKDGGTTLLNSSEASGSTIQADTTFTAQYTHVPYMVTFDLASHGRSDDTLTFSSVYYGDLITLPTVDSNRGWKFIGWDTTPSTTVKGNAAYTAVYKHIRYNVLFELSAYGTSTDTLTFDPVYYGDTIVVPTVTGNPGWEFAGWDTTPSTTVTGSEVYTAQYTQIPYEVTFDLAGCGTSTDTLTFDPVYYGDTIVVPTVTGNPGWEFSGWDTTPSTTVTGSLVYTAQYTHIPYEVTFDLAGCGTSTDTLTFDPVYYGDAIVVPTVTGNPGWEFSGWDTTPSTTVTGSLVYTAQYTHIPYEVTFDLAGCGTSTDTLTFDPVYYGDTIVVPTVTANHGWIFMRWDITPSTTVTGSIIYTALYQIYRPK